MLDVHYCFAFWTFGLLSELRIFTIKSQRTQFQWFFIFIFQMFVVWVFEAMYLWTAINLNVQSHLIVLKGAFWIPSVVVIGISSFFSFCLSIFHLIYFALTMYGNSTHIHTVTFIHTTKGTNRKCKTKQEKKEDIIIRMLLLLHRTFQSPLFAVERYCFRVILHCRDTFDIKSSVCVRVYIVCAYRKQR